MLRAPRARSQEEAFCDENSAPTSRPVSTLAKSLSKPREQQKSHLQKIAKIADVPTFVGVACSCPGVQVFIARYILDPQIFRHLSRFIFDMSPQKNLAFIEKHSATTVEGANRYLYKARNKIATRATCATNPRPVIVHRSQWWTRRQLRLTRWPRDCYAASCQR